MNDLVNFKSIFKDEFIEFVKYKRLSGNEYNEKTYRKFIDLDNFFKEENLIEKKITLDIIEKWLNKNPNNSEITKSIRYNTITAFSKFLITKDYKNIFIIPENPYHSRCLFIPYIYSKEEISRIFNILSTNKNNNNGLLLYTCISILYCCGLRIGELINLKLKDFNYENNTLIIEKGKNDVKRLIPLNTTLYNLLKEYISYNIYTSNNDFLFKNKVSRNHIYNLIRINFKDIMKNAGIQYISKNKLPRLHDLRHTFAVHTLDNMLEHGFELYQCLPTLSVYLGHKSVYETEYYLRLTERNFNDFTNKIFNYTSNIYERKDRIYNGK